MEYSGGVCGVQWRCVCVEYSGGKCVWSTVEVCVCVEYSGGKCVWSRVEVSVCGVEWR